MRRVRETQRHISTVSQELSGLVRQPVGTRAREMIHHHVFTKRIYEISGEIS